MATIFSKIAAGEIPSYKCAEDENFYAFLDINPVTKGHTLVIPRKEVDYIFDMDDEHLAAFQVFAKKVAVAIRKAFPCKKVAQVVLGLEVNHAHIHLMPINSDTILEDSHNNIIKLPEGKLAVINGLDGYIVAEKDNVLLICKKEDSSALIRKYVTEVQIKKGERFI